MQRTIDPFITALCVERSSLSFFADQIQLVLSGFLVLLKSLKSCCFFQQSGSDVENAQGSTEG